MLERIPQTVKAFHRMLSEINSTSLLRAMFLCSYVFEVECLQAGYSAQDKNSLGRKLGLSFSHQLSEKARILSVWGYPHMVFDEYLSPFMS